MSYIILIGFIFCILGSSLWSPGGILLLDYVFTPYALINWYEPIIFPITNTLVSILGVQWVSKAFFAIILFMSIYLGILYGRRISDMYIPRYRRVLEVFGGIFFLMNPYAYERMMVQPTIYLSMILLGYGIYILFFSEKRGFDLTKTILL